MSEGLRATGATAAIACRTKEAASHLFFFLFPTFAYLPLVCNPLLPFFEAQMLDITFITADTQLYSDAAAFAAKSGLLVEMASPRDKLPAMPTAIVYDVGIAEVLPGGVPGFIESLLSSPVAGTVGLMGYGFSDETLAALERHGIVVTRDPDHRFFTRLVKRIRARASQAA